MPDCATSAGQAFFCWHDFIVICLPMTHGFSDFLELTNANAFSMLLKFDVRQCCGSEFRPSAKSVAPKQKRHLAAAFLH
ncbi:MAG TPA: hypothetical protein VF798_09870 [Burkholderiaceae bacterium]